jgi:hypothetical protein
VTNFVVLSDIHRMNGCVEVIVVPFAGLGKTAPPSRERGMPVTASGDALHAFNDDLGLIRTHLSLHSRWNSWYRAAHAGAGNGCGRGPAISRRISAKSILEMVTSAIWKAT